MTKTCASYIHEYSLFDDVFDCLNETVREADIAVAKYNMKMHQLESKMLFEAANPEDVKKVQHSEGKGALARIGEAVMRLITKVTTFIKSFTDKLTGSLQLGKSDSEKVNQILTKNPELKDKVIEGINKEWFTVHDVAKFEKDVVGLIQMLDKNALDHQTFMDKFRARCESFTKAAKPIAEAGSTIVTLVSIFPKLGKAAQDTKETLVSINKTAKEYREKFENNYQVNEVSKAHAITNALGQVTGILTEDAKKHATATSGIGKIIHNFCNGAVGKALKLDDASASERRDRSIDRTLRRKAGEAMDYQRKREGEAARRFGVRNITGGAATDEDLDAVPGLGKRANADYKKIKKEAKKKP